MQIVQVATDIQSRYAWYNVNKYGDLSSTYEVISSGDCSSTLQQILVQLVQSLRHLE